jgi:hypothetical protein
MMHTLEFLHREVWPLDRLFPNEATKLIFDKLLTERNITSLGWRVAGVAGVGR